MKEKRAAEKYGQNFKDMTFKKKREHIWEYYRWHIICGIIGIFLLCSALDFYIFNPPRKPFAVAAFYGEYVSDEARWAFSDALDMTVVTDNERFTVDTYNYYEAESDPSFSATLREKFYMNIAAKELDIVMGPYLEIRYLANSNMLLDLTKVFDEQELSELDGSVINESIVHRDDNDEYYLGDEQPFIISLPKTEFFESCGIDADDWVFAFITNSQRPENGKAIFYEIYKK